MTVGRVLSPLTRDALQILGTTIRVARKQRGWTIEALAERVGVSPPTIQKLELGEAGVAIGTVFEAAVLVGVPLFDPDPTHRRTYATGKRLELALLPESTRPSQVVNDDF